MTIYFKQVILISVFSVLLASCSTSMMVNDGLASDMTVLEVKGRSGGVPGQKLIFGEYTSSKVERKIASAEAETYAVSSKIIRDTMQFNVFGPAGDSSRVFCLSKKSQLSLPIGGENYKVAVGDQNACFGMIVLDGGDDWNFTIATPSSIAPDAVSEGVISNGKTTVNFKAINKNNKGKTMDGQVLGFEFWQGNEIIGAVELIGSGRVFIKKSLSEGMKSLVATTAATMLMRCNMNNMETKEE